MNNKDDFDFPDIEPMLLWEGNPWMTEHQPFWVNPFYDSRAEVDENDLTQNLYIMQIGNLSIAFVSRWVGDRFHLYHEESDEKSELYEKYVDLDLLACYLYVLLIEDVYIPTNKSGTRCAKQFCFTRAGKKASKLMGLNPLRKYFTPDCGFWKDENGMWGYDT